jgi:hypothetical protein
LEYTPEERHTCQNQKTLISAAKAAVKFGSLNIKIQIMTADLLKKNVV